MIVIMKYLKNIIYEQNDNAWEEYSSFIQELIEQYSPETVCDIGGGANPLLSLDFIINHRIDYTILDISQTELDKTQSGYKKCVKDIEADDFPCGECFDFVFSKMLVEDLHDGKKFHRNIYKLLTAGGIAVHYYPTLFALPFLVNKMIPENVSSFLLDAFMPRERNRLGKFPAFYSWCYGPTQSMLNMLTGIGFEIMEFRGIIGHQYFKRIPWIRDVHRAYNCSLVKHPNPFLTSFAQIILRKPIKSG
jgi:hypothetical protein